MDGHFVPNLSFGAPVIRCIKTNLPLDIHLMVSNPADRLEEFFACGVHNITFHAEAVQETNERQKMIQRIHAHGVRAGIALNPETPLSVIDDIFTEIDLLLIMSVHPGFSGQSFIADVLKKVEEARVRRPELMIQMDGGIDANTALLAQSAGANNLVAASAIFGKEDRKMAISALRC
jgi:ribulose-phosphate 3-epimerase